MSNIPEAGCISFVAHFQNNCDLRVLPVEIMSILRLKVMCSVEMPMSAILTSLAMPLEVMTIAVLAMLLITIPNDLALSVLSGRVESKKMKEEQLKYFIPKPKMYPGPGQVQHAHTSEQKGWKSV